MEENEGNAIMECHGGLEGGVRVPKLQFQSILLRPATTADESCNSNKTKNWYLVFILLQSFIFISRFTLIPVTDHFTMETTPGATLGSASRAISGSGAAASRITPRTTF